MRKTAPKKKMNRKMKRTIRKSLSAMFMITALVVAAIPVQENTAAGTSILADGDVSGNEVVEPLSENSYPEETVTDENGNEVTQLKTEYEIDGIRYDKFDDTVNTIKGLAIVEENGSYVERHMYNLKKIKGSSGDFAIAGYNKDIIPKDNGTSGTLVIPNKIASEYLKFTEDDVTGSDYYEGGEPSKTHIKKRYINYYGDQNLPDFENMQQNELKKYARNLYACDESDYTGGYIAQAVRVIKDNSNQIVEEYIPYSEEFGFFAETEYAIAAIGKGAFAENAFSEVNEDAEGTGSVKIYNLVIGDNIKGIGDSAFKGSENLKSLTLGMANVSIGNHAFQNCSGLREVNFEETIQIIGAEAFRGCSALTSLNLKGALNTIGAGAFADCVNLSTLDMTEVPADTEICDFAFYNCIKLSTVNFTKYGTTKRIGTGAFAVSDGLSNSVTGSWKNVVFPDGVTSFGESVLEGRKNLETCTLPQTYGAKKLVTLDGGFFRRCSNLKSVTINGPYVQFCTELGERDCNPFWWVTTEQFYVEGPANLDDSADYKNPLNYSYPRTSTQRAQKTFKFTTKDGVEYYEIAVACEDDPDTKVDESEFTDYYLVNADTGALESYTPDSDSVGTDASTVIRIMGEYNGVSVKSIAEGCFDEVKTTATGLIVEDNTIEEISAKAFADFIALKYADIGNSVKTIGEEAFAGCVSLKDVYFRMDSVTIEKAAFKTNGKNGLIFHGKMESGFEPFDFAMNKDNDIDGQGLRILYMTLEPSNVAAIYDNGESTDEKAAITMISYPVNNADDTNAMIAENVLYEDAVKNIVIPAGVTSIDTKTYYSSGKNSSSEKAYVLGAGENDSIVYTHKASTSYQNNEEADDTVLGIFSGIYDDFSVGKGITGENESFYRGNDYVESITMSTVESLPDYAFDSCESLKTVILGDAMTDIGTSPFRGCTSLASVGGNSEFVCENGILYQDNGDGTYTLVQCLPGRASSSISNATDPLIDKVSKICESAFENCTNLKIVDLSTATNLTVIPKNCFRGCTGLNEVFLPESVNEIREGAFKDIWVETSTGEMSCNLTVKIPSREVYINSDAFDKTEDVIIWTYIDTSAWRFAEDNGLTPKPLDDDNHFVKFLDSDFVTVLHSATIPHGGNVIFPSEKLPEKKGYKFEGWGCLTEGVTVESPVLDDYIFIAKYTPTSGSGSGSGSASGNNGNTGNNGTTDGDGTNSGDSNALYTVTVINGSGSGSYKEGATVIITANEPATGKQFKNWTTDNTDITLASTRLSATTFTMPAGNVTVTANYEDASSSSSSSSSSGSGSSVSGNSSNRYSQNGTKVVITRPGISDTDLAAAKVNGSNEGFIVKISETAEATAAVEAALINKYGSLDNIRYCAMDISLYDSTGTTKITDTTGFTIDITIPIPDALKEYAGNNKTAAVVNSQLENLSPKFTTIDGVPCVTFRATHFSPYTVYVDTQNLSATGTLDTTPKTGDGIHPKWFLSIGLACISVVLFMKKDKRTVNVKVA